MDEGRGAGPGERAYYSKGRFSLPGPGHCWPGRRLSRHGYLVAQLYQAYMYRDVGDGKRGGAGCWYIDIYNFYLNYLTVWPKETERNRENFYVDAG